MLSSDNILIVAPTRQGTEGAERRPVQFVYSTIMNIGNSQLLKKITRTILLHYCRPGQPGIMDSIIQYLLNRSKLDVSLINITEATEEYECDEELSERC